MSIDKISPESLAQAIEMFEENGLLARVDHGFCWTCGQEKEVMEISSGAFPSQEPKCAECIISVAMYALTLPEFRNRLEEVYRQTYGDESSGS